MPKLKGTFDKYDAVLFGQELCNRINKIDYENLSPIDAHQIATLFKALAIEIEPVMRKED